jgi:hypothetical protein
MVIWLALVPAGETCDPQASTHPHQNTKASVQPHHSRNLSLQPSPKPHFPNVTSSTNHKKYGMFAPLFHRFEGLFVYIQPSPLSNVNTGAELTMGIRLRQVCRPVGKSDTRNPRTSHITSTSRRNSRDGSLRKELLPKPSRNTWLSTTALLRPSLASMAVARSAQVTC